jgi:predicted RNA-binding protein with PIN domain
MRGYPKNNSEHNESSTICFLTTSKETADKQFEREIDKENMKIDRVYIVTGIYIKSSIFTTET